MAHSGWQALDPRLRGALLVAAGVDAGLRIAALLDLAQRPPGGRARWAVPLATIGSAGVLPLAYLLRVSGRT